MTGVITNFNNQLVVSQWILRLIMTHSQENYSVFNCLYIIQKLVASFQRTWNLLQTLQTSRPPESVWNIQAIKKKTLFICFQFKI